MTPAQYNEYQRMADVINEAKKWKEKENLTALEWFYQQIVIEGKTNYYVLFEQAKKMEKEQSILFANECIEKWDMPDKILEIDFIEKIYYEMYQK